MKFALGYKAFRLGFLLLALSTASAQAQVLSFDQAKQRADAGDAFAQAVVALHYQLGWNTQKNPQLAAKYAIASAEAGHPLGQFRLGALLRAGEGAPKDEQQGLALQSASFNALYNAQDPYSITSAAIMIFQGKVVGQDVSQDERRRDAAALYKKAADMNYAPAQFNYAMCAEAGHGMAKDKHIRNTYLQKALLLEYPPARDFQKAALSGIAKPENGTQKAATSESTFTERPPESLNVSNEYEGTTEEWSYEFLPDENVAYVRFQDAPGEIVFADDEWIVKCFGHRSKIALKQLFDLYFFDAKTLRLVSAIRAPNVLEAVDRIKGQGIFALLINSPSSPHYCLGNLALLIVDPATSRMEKFDVAQNGSRDPVLNLTIKGHEIHVTCNPDSTQIYNTGAFKSNVFEDLRIRIYPSQSSQVVESTESFIGQIMVSPKAGAAALRNSGVNFIEGESLNSRRQVSQHQNIESSEFDDEEKAKKRKSPFAVGHGAGTTLHAGVNLMARTSSGRLRLLNLEKLINRILDVPGDQHWNFGITPDGTAYSESEGSFRFINGDKVVTIPLKQAEAIVEGNCAYVVPKDRAFGIHDPYNGKVALPPIKPGISVAKWLTTGEKESLRLQPSAIGARFASAERNNTEAVWRYFWDFFPASDALVVAEAMNWHSPSVSYSVFPQKDQQRIPVFPVELGLHAGSDIRLGQSSRGWQPISLLTAFYNVGPSYSIVLWSQKLERFFHIEEGMRGHPGILHLQVKEDGKARLLYSHSDSVRLVKFDGSKAFDVAPNTENDAQQKLGDTSAYSMPYEIVQEWKTVSAELPALFIEGKDLLFVPKLSGYEVFNLSADAAPRKLCEVFLSGEQDYAIVLPDGTYCGSPGVEREIIAKAGSDYLVDASTLAPWRNRPAEVLEALNGDQEQIEILDKVTRRWLARMGNPERASEPRPEDVPKLELSQSVPLWAESDTAAIHFRAVAADPSKAGVMGAIGSLLGSGKAQVDRLSVRVNGVEQTGAVRTGSSEGNWSQEVRLAAGQNWIEASAVDTKGVVSNLVRFRMLLPKSGRAARRFIVALGVSDYQQEALNLTYAAKDAKDVASTLGVATDDAKTLVLLNNEVTKSSLARVEEFLKEAREKDEVIVFCAGHGVLDENLDYVFAGHDFDPEHPTETGIKLDDLIATISKSRSLKRLLLMDTCHAGVVGEKDEMLLAQMDTKLPTGVRAVAQRGMKVQQAADFSASDKQRFIEEMFSLPGTIRGVNIIGASAGAQFALESDKWNNGVFTASVIEGLRDKKADWNQDGRITVSELKNYLGQRVSELTAGAQKPSVVAFEQDQDFDLLN
jgi:TPR repeat protein